MSRNLLHEVDGVPVYFDPVTALFEAEIDGIVRRKQSLADIKRALRTRRTPVSAIRICQWPRINLSAQVVLIRGWRRNRWTDERDHLHTDDASYLVYDPALLAELEQLVQKGQEIVEAWNKAVGTANRFSATDLSQPETAEDPETAKRRDGETARRRDGEGTEGEEK